MLEELPLPQPLLQAMAETKQNPRYHAEGSVLDHTILVLQKYREFSSLFELSPADHEVLYWAAVLHDTGKIITTKWIDERWRSPGHERAGVPIAMDILLQHPEISTAQRQRILQLVRWHGFPLQFGRTKPGISALKLLGTTTDLRILGIFSLFDFAGRLCEDKEWVMSVVKKFMETDVPQAEYELGKYDDLQRAFSAMNFRHKNAVWTAYFKGMTDLMGKLFEAEPKEDIATFNKKIYLTVGPPLSGKTQWLSQNLQDVFRISMAEHGLAEDDLVDRFYMDRKLVEFKHFLVVYLNRYKTVALDGCNLNMGYRHRLNEMFRGLGVEIEYLVFEERIATINSRNAALEKPYRQADLDELYAMQDLIHPWEAHKITYVT